MLERYSKGKSIALQTNDASMTQPTAGGQGGALYPGGDQAGGAQQVIPANITIRGNSGAATITQPVTLWYYIDNVWHEAQTLSAVDLTVSPTAGWVANISLSPHADRAYVESAGTSAGVDVTLLQYNAP